MTPSFMNSVRLYHFRNSGFRNHIMRSPISHRGSFMIVKGRLERSLKRCYNFPQIISTPKVSAVIFTDRNCQ